MDDCPCGSDRPLSNCCGRYHDGEVAKTAADLMKSRYSAYVLEDERYLLDTWHPATRPESISFDPTQEWLGLDIVDTTKGGMLDTEGSVTFVARFAFGDDRRRLIENSRFVRDAGRWWYVDPVDAEIISDAD